MGRLRHGFGALAGDQVAAGVARFERANSISARSWRWVAGRNGIVSAVARTFLDCGTDRVRRDDSASSGLCSDMNGFAAARLKLASLMKILFYASLMLWLVIVALGATDIAALAKAIALFHHG